MTRACKRHISTNYTDNTLFQNIVKMMQLLTYICYIVHPFIFISMLFRQGINVAFPLNQMTLFWLYKNTHACPISCLLDKYKDIHNEVENELTMKKKNTELFFGGLTVPLFGTLTYFCAS